MDLPWWSEACSVALFGEITRNGPRFGGAKKLHHLTDTLPLLLFCFRVLPDTRSQFSPTEAAADAWGIPGSHIFLGNNNRPPKFGSLNPGKMSRSQGQLFTAEATISIVVNQFFFFLKTQTTPTQIFTQISKRLNEASYFFRKLLLTHPQVRVPFRLSRAIFGKLQTTTSLAHELFPDMRFFNWETQVVNGHLPGTFSLF